MDESLAQSVVDSAIRNTEAMLRDKTYTINIAILGLMLIKDDLSKDKANSSALHNVDKYISELVARRDAPIS